MSMTLEEATEILRKRKRYCKVIANHANATVKADELREIEAIDIALAALRGPTREMMERMRGEWMFPVFADQQDANDPRCQCSECGSIETPLARHRFCPACGSPMTDEAADMMLERWKEALNGKAD